MRPSEEIDKLWNGKTECFKSMHPHFFTDHGYWPDFRYDAICDWLDKQKTEPKIGKK